MQFTITQFRIVKIKHFKEKAHELINNPSTIIYSNLMKTSIGYSTNLTKTSNNVHRPYLLFSYKHYNANNIYKSTA